MSEKRFEDDGVEYNNNYNYALLDTYYEFDGERIIEWNKHSSNAEYTDFERITEILNIKQMRLESLMKHREEVGKLFDRIDEQQEHITHLEDTNDNFRIKLIEDIEAMEQAEKKIGEQQATITEYEDFCYNLCMFIIGKDLDDEFREKYGKEYKIITKWKGD